MGGGDRRVLWGALLCVCIAVLFWTGSRYPALNEKALMGGGTVLEDPLGFEAVLPVDPGDPVLRRIAHTTVNWLATNRQGMTFGVLLAAAFMTLFHSLRTTRLQGHFANSLLGVVIGAPLGVCVNCAAPIARGLHASGARLETALAAMISSPTLNVVVLVMLFSLFPLYMAVIKLGLSLLFMLVAIPLLSRLAFRREVLQPPAAKRLADTGAWALAPDEPADAGDLGGLAALRWVARDFGRNLWFVARYTVPLMFLAGLLGAVTVTLLPWEDLHRLLPDAGGWATVVGIASVGLVGLFVPVPIAFDVVVIAALLAGGMPVGYAMALLFSLGIFSVYSFLIVWDSVSLRVAAVLALALWGLTLAAGSAARAWEQERSARQVPIFEAFRRAELEPAVLSEPPRGADLDALESELAPPERSWESFPVSLPAGVTAERRAFRPRLAGSAPLFRRFEGGDFGLTRYDGVPSAYRFSSPWYNALPIAAGDVNRDGWVDLAIGSGRGVQLHLGRGGDGFVQQGIDVPALADLYVGAVALVDLDGDSWLDLVVGGYRGGNHVVLSDRGRFGTAGHRELPDGGTNLSIAIAFGDLDRDGDLDLVLGNWTSGRWNGIPPASARNAILWNQGDGAFRMEPLPGIPGETLSVLLSDVDNDGWLDLFAGNDFGVADTFYLSGGEGQLRMIRREDDIVPHVTQSTMSIDSADLDNDLVPEVYLGQVTGGAPGQMQRRVTKPVAELCEELEGTLWEESCRENVRIHGVVFRASEDRDAAKCLALVDPAARGDCIGYVMLRRGVKTEPSLCDWFPAAWERFAYICAQSQLEPPDPEAVRRDGLRQIWNHNVLLVRDGEGRYADLGRDLGVDLGGWTWNARFADVDNDEWQDLFIVNGSYRVDLRESTVFLSNRAGRGFEDRTEAAGLRSFLVFPSYVYADFDADGDLDIVGVTAEGPVWVFRNESTSGASVVFELDDRVGNRLGIGSRLEIHYGPDGERRQMREIKASGGFASRDAAEAHFGLGDHRQVEAVRVRWSTGETSELVGPFAAGHRYRLRRSAVAGG